uniref:hypothetical protein n=1 Tax=Amycolatopsis sp. CA-096443 TaxID=3239919 RepID=UPI003F4918C1
MPAESPAAVWVRIYHNNSAIGSAFLAGHTVTEVFAYAAPGGVHDFALAEEAFDVFGDDASEPGSDPRVLEYRSCGNRPMVPGDVVSVEDRFYLNHMLEWRALVEAPVIEQAAVPGTVPLRIPPTRSQDDIVALRADYAAATTGSPSSIRRFKPGQIVEARVDGGDWKQYSYSSDAAGIHWVRDDPLKWGQEYPIENEADIRACPGG